jgi:hypothetical protein
MRAGSRPAGQAHGMPRARAGARVPAWACRLGETGRENGGALASEVGSFPGARILETVSFVTITVSI